MEKIIRKGFVQAMDGSNNECWVNTQTDEMVKISFKDRDQAWRFYCKPVKITVEIIEESELTEKEE
jgi:hypothetical protein